MLTDAELQQWATFKSSALVPVGVRIPKVFYREGKKLGKKQGLSFSQFVRRALAREFLSQKEKR
jgi:hypothetical protein